MQESYINIYACKYIFVYIFVCIYIPVYTCAYAYTYTYIYTYTCTCKCICIHMYIYIYMYILCMYIYINIHVCICIYIYTYIHIYIDTYIHNIYICLSYRHRRVFSHMGWLWLVGPIKLQVSFAKEPYKRDDILQKRRFVLSILLTIATPYQEEVYHLSFLYMYL